MSGGQPGKDFRGPLGEGSFEKFSHWFVVLGILKRWFASLGKTNVPVLLVVAESRVTQETFHREFEPLGCKVVSALSGQNAWLLLETGPLPDLIVLDYFFSKEDGPSFFRRIRMDKRFALILVVPLPFSATDESAAGGVKTIEKVPTSPFEMTTTPYALLKSVAQALRKNKAILPRPFKEELNRQAKLNTGGIIPAGFTDKA